jgi:uncharacterized C2H2 Zn-finger protein
MRSLEEDLRREVFTLIKFTPKQPEEEGRIDVLRCPVCGQQYRTLGTLKRHFKSHFNGSGVKCPVCGSQFNNNVGLRNHLAFRKDIEHIVLHFLTTRRMNPRRRKIAVKALSGGSNRED